MIPFLEHDDANRALMGSNMQRQGVPLLVTEAPLVGTGLEGKVARDSRAVIVAEEAGKVASVTGRPDHHHRRTASCPKARRSSRHDPGNGRLRLRAAQVHALERRHLHQPEDPIVKKGEHVKKGQVIADGPCTEQGELALGRNVLVAFMPWNGYNFEDAILISRDAS